MSSWPKVKSAIIDVEAASHAPDLNLINATRVNLVVLIGVRHTLPTATRHKAPLCVETTRGLFCLIHPESALSGLGGKMGRAK